MTDISVVENLLEPHDLVILGALPETVLVGNAGSTFWRCFKVSPEYSDSLPDSLDRWSKRIGLAAAAELNARVIFPFEGPPYPPVLDWAKTSGHVFPSPISMFIHYKYGLWHAYRFALIFSEPLSGALPSPDTDSPCLSCWRGISLPGRARPVSHGCLPGF